MAHPTAIVWRGPSLLDGAPIRVVLTFRSGNPKIGDMVQAWILRDDVTPLAAIRSGADSSVCGACPLKRSKGLGGRVCYVNPQPLASIGRKMRRKGSKGYPEISLARAAELIAGRSLRIGAYGDPAAVPFSVWATLATHAAKRTGYTHQWRTCDQRLRALVMASCETVAGATEARAAGWRVFRAKMPGAPLMAGEIYCPSERVACARCGLCCGTELGGKSVAIDAHGRGARLFAALFGGAQ